MDIIVNGKVNHLEEKISLAEFLKQRGFEAKAAVVEYNGEIVPSEQWEDIALSPADRLEIVTFVGGG